MRYIFLLLAKLCTVFVWGLEPLMVFVSIEPQRYLVERIGGNRVKVETMVPPGKNHHTYEPSPSQIATLSRAKIWMTIGIDFERAILPRVKKAYPHLRIENVSQGIVKRKMTKEELGEHAGHKHKGKDHHHHEEKVGADDPHVWVSLRSAQVQASNIFHVLIAMDSEGQDVYQKNYQILVKELQDLDQKVQQTLLPYEGKVFFVYHPVLGYFADDYGLRQVAVEVGGKEPAPAVLNAVIQKAKKEKVKVVFVQEGFSRRSAQAVAQAIGGKVVEINPLLSDYPYMFQKLVEALIEAWK